MINVTEDWLITSLFYLGVLLIPVGLALIIIPARILAWGNSVNRWISTANFFNSLDESRNYERIYYKHHRLVGGIFIVLTAISIYMLGFYSGISATADGFERLADTVFGQWLLKTGYFILLVLCLLALVAGLVIFFRPSMLKSLETWSNRWIDTQTRLVHLDDVHEIPMNIFPGKPRVFGCFVLAGALYIVYITGVILF